MAANRKITAAFKVKRPMTWLDRPGQVATTSDAPSRRLIVHRWSDDGSTTFREVRGDGRTKDFDELRRVDMGVTASIEEAVKAAEALRTPTDEQPDLIQRARDSVFADKAKRGPFRGVPR